MKVGSTNWEELDPTSAKAAWMFDGLTPSMKYPFPWENANVVIVYQGWSWVGHLEKHAPKWLTTVWLGNPTFYAVETAVYRAAKLYSQNPNFAEMPLHEFIERSLSEETGGSDTVPV